VFHTSQQIHLIFSANNDYFDNNPAPFDSQPVYHEVQKPELLSGGYPFELFDENKIKSLPYDKQKYWNKCKKI
jgi:hypothetical protein